MEDVNQNSIPRSVFPPTVFEMEGVQQNVQQMDSWGVGLSSEERLNMHASSILSKV